MVDVENYAWLIWIVVALGLGALELATVDFTFLMLAGGALGGSAAAAVGAPFPVQAIVAAASAIVLLGVVRPAAHRRFRTHRPPTSIGVGGYRGRLAVVLETVTPTAGSVRIGGETWSARTDSHDVLAPGEHATVLDIDGATAVVERADSPHDSTP
ncbi:MAG TPA: NfeD family protein [Dermatophilaceae bacterium]|nr:NfeD family protein [Dermatophilaceae bacterium]